MLKPPEVESAEELCEEIWSLTEAGDNTTQRLLGGSKLPDPAAALESLVGQGLARVAAGRAFLTPEGGVIARAIVRRHRLAEVLLTQVLALAESVSEPTACEMEHILSAQVADSICTYLGHPPRCPHGKPIPRGLCCEVFRTELKPLVVRLPDLAPGETGQIVFITASSQGSLEKIASLGVVPGKPIRLIQRKPSVVFEAGRTSVAVDQEIAAEIFVRRSGQGR